MKSFVSVLLALALSATALVAQTPAGAPPKATEPPASAAPGKELAVTRINGPGPAGKAGAPATKAGYIAEEKEAMNLWKIVSEGGWVKIGRAHV